MLYEPELHLHSDVLVPDLAGGRRERMPEMPHAAAFELAPDWVCEVLSPGTAATDRSGKMPVYAREQVRHIWLVDPITRTLEATGSSTASGCSSGPGAAMPRCASSRSRQSSSSSQGSGQDSDPERIARAGVATLQDVLDDLPGGRMLGFDE